MIDEKKIEEAAIENSEKLSDGKNIIFKEVKK